MESKETPLTFSKANKRPETYRGAILRGRISVSNTDAVTPDQAKQFAPEFKIEPGRALTGTFMASSEHDLVVSARFFAAEPAAAAIERFGHVTYDVTARCAGQIVLSEDGRPSRRRFVCAFVIEDIVPCCADERTNERTDRRSLSELGEMLG